jgi:hypothetical protein
MSAVKQLNPNAEVARAAQALQLNIQAATGLQSVLRTNLGPKGTMKVRVPLAAGCAFASTFWALDCSSPNLVDLFRAHGECNLPHENH